MDPGAVEPLSDVSIIRDIFIGMHHHLLRSNTEERI